MKKLKNIVSNKFYRLVYCVIAAFLVAIQEQMQAFAASASTEVSDAEVDAIVKQVTGPIDAIVKIIFGIMGAIGMLIFARGLSNLLAAWGDHDTTTMRHEAVQCGIGVALGSVGTLVALFYNN